MSHQANDLAAHILDDLNERAFRTMALLPSRAEKMQVAVAVANHTAGWAAGVVHRLSQSNDPLPKGSDLLRWVADEMDKVRHD